MVDKVMVIVVKQVEQAIALLLACYYMFNIQYPSNAANTMEFIQR